MKALKAIQMLKLSAWGQTLRLKTWGSRVLGHALCALLGGKSENKVLPALTPKFFGKPLNEADDNLKVLVMLAGCPDTHDVWDKQIKEFGSDYAIVSITTPDYDQNELRAEWGYSPREINKMFQACINQHLPAGQKFDIMIHDWGAYWGFLLAGRLNQQTPRRVNKIVALEIGCAVTGNPMKETTRGAFWRLPYQWAFALVFWLGKTVHPSVAQGFQDAFVFVNPVIGPWLWSFDSTKQCPRPKNEMRWWMMYPYYQLWVKPICTRKIPPLPNYEALKSTPIFFGYGTQKRAFFHSDEFAAEMERRPDCQIVAYDSSHWIMHEKPAELNADARKFLLTGK